tara:strand:- start:765 stop:3539 length:2775 start_codon:yes stop_codon:yes gene_type:complete
MPFETEIPPYASHVGNPEMSLRFYVKIQGLPYIFLSGETPVAQSGTAWAAPSGYTVLANSLDASDVQDIGCSVSRIDGSASPASMLIRLLEDRSYTLGGIFAWDKTDGNLANLTADFPYDVSGGASDTLFVDDTTGWPASGNIHLGRECMFYHSKTDTTFQVSTRQQFDPVGDGDTVYRHNSNLPSAPRVAADHPRVFIGRYVQVHAHWVTADGYAVDTAYDGDNSFECFRGVIRELPRPGSDWHSFEFEIEAIDSILRTEVGVEARQAQLVGSPLALSFGYNVESEIPQAKIYLVSQSTSRLHVRITDSSGSIVLNAVDENAININALTIPPASAVLNEQQLLDNIAESLDSALTTPTSGNLSLAIVKNKKKTKYLFRAVASAVFTVEIFCNRSDSVTKLFGFGDDLTQEVGGSTTHFYFGQVPVADALAVYVDSQATSVPFTYVEDANLLTDIAPAVPGFAVIGDDEECEIISYTGISSLSSSAGKGLFELTNVRRGLMGTVARYHKVTHEEAKEGNQGADIRFGLGVENDSFLLTILNLAQSTGDGNHGQYDLFGVGVGIPLAPGHFDAASFLEAAADLTPTEQTISYFLSKPEALSDLAKDWLTPVGRFMFPRINRAGNYTIGIGKNQPPIPAEADLSLTTTQLQWSDPATYQRGADTIVTGVTVYPVWDFAEEESNDDVKVSVINHDAEAEFGQRNVIEWKLRGYVIGPGQALDLTKNWAAQLAERHGRGRVVLELQAGREAWFSDIGDTVELTVPQIPTPDGGRGLVTRYGIIENIVKVFSGSQPGCIIRVVVESSNLAQSYRPYASSGKVASKSSNTITLEQNEYSEQGYDADGFNIGDVVVIHNEGDYSTREQKTITNIVGNVITLNTAVSLTVGSYTAIDYDDYDQVTSDQKLEAAYISDSTHTLSNADEGHRYT